MPQPSETDADWSDDEHLDRIFAAWASSWKADDAPPEPPEPPNSPEPREPPAGRHPVADPPDPGDVPDDGALDPGDGFAEGVDPELPWTPGDDDVIPRAPGRRWGRRRR